MTPLLVIRPEPGCAASVAAARELGLEAECWPLFAVRPVDWEAPDPGGFDALLVGSANAFRHAGPLLERYAALPVHAVGEATAREARQAGFAVGTVGRGGLQAVLDSIPPGTRLLRLAGAERVPLTAPQGVTLAERVVYASEPLPMPSGLAARLHEPAVVALHSAEAARHFAAECDRLELDRGLIALATIGPRVSGAAGTGWRTLACPERPEEAALLETARDLCQTLGEGKESRHMVEDVQTETPASAPIAAASPLLPERRGTGRAVLGAALIAFLLGAGTVGYAAWHGMLPGRIAPPPVISTEPLSTAAPALTASRALAVQDAGVDARIVALEGRLDAITARADAAAGNAARAEALLVAAASRRAIDRGAPLGYLEDQLRLRFGNSQPGAVATLVDAGRSPVTLDQLLAGLDSLAPSLTASPSEENAWRKVKREVASLFVIRRESAPSPAPRTVLERARLLLEAGRTDEAMTALQRLPGAGEARDWFVAARRYDDVHRALDVLESAALLDTRALRDGDGEMVNRPAFAPPAG